MLLINCLTYCHSRMHDKPMPIEELRDIINIDILVEQKTLKYSAIHFK